MPHDRNPGPPGNAPTVMKYTAMYRIDEFVLQRRIENPAMGGNVAQAKYIPRCRVLSLMYAIRIAPRQAATYGGTEYSCALVAVHPRSAKIVGMKMERPCTVILIKKNPAAHTLLLMLKMAALI